MHLSRTLRIVRWLVTLVLGAEGLYVLAANSFLSMGGLTVVFAGTDSAKVEFASAWTLVPGTIHARGLSITVQDHNVQSFIALDEVRVVLSLPELLSHVLHATEVRGEGLVFRFRHRIQPEAKDAPSVRALPPIPGFSDPPLYHAWAPEPPIPDARYNLWSVHLEDVDIGAKELWGQQFRYLGRARATGSFALKPARRLWVGPASLVLDGGHVVVAGKEMIKAFAGKIECTIDPFDVRVPEGFAVLREVSTRVSLRGDVVGNEFLGVFLPVKSHTHVDLSGAHLVISAGLKRGVITESSRIALTGDALKASTNSLSVQVDGPWSVLATSAAGGGRGQLAVNVGLASLTRNDRPSAPAKLRGAVLGVTSNSLDVTKPWAVVAADVSLRELDAPDLRLLNDVRLGSIRFRSGAGVLRGNLAYSGGTISGQGAGELRAVVADVSSSQLAGNLTFNGQAHAFNWQKETGSFDLKLLGSALSVADASGDADCPWARFERAEAEAHLVLLPGGRASGKLDASIDGGRLRWGDVRVTAGADVRATIDPTHGAESGKSRLSGIVRAFHLRVKAGSGAPKRWNAEVPETIVDADLLLHAGMLEGPVEITAKRARATIGDVSMRTDVHARLHADPLDLDHRSAIVSGVVDLTRASLANQERRVDDWWAKIGLSPTRITAAEDLDLDGRVSARFRDGLPALLALSATDEIPSFLPDLLPLHGLVGTVNVRRHCKLTDLQFSSFEGGPLIAKGRVQNAPGDTRGAVLVQLTDLNLVSAGLTLGKPGGVSLLVGEDWLKEQVAPLGQEAANLWAHACPPAQPSTCE